MNQKMWSIDTLSHQNFQYNRLLYILLPKDFESYFVCRFTRVLNKRPSFEQCFIRGNYCFYDPAAFVNFNVKFYTFFLQRISCLAQNLVLSWRFCRLRFFTCCLLNLLLLLHLTKLVHQVDFLLIQFQNFIRSHLFFTFDLHLELFYASWYRIAFDIAFVVDGDELFFTSWLLTVIVVQKFWDGSWSHLLTVD